MSTAQISAVPGMVKRNMSYSASPVLVKTNQKNDISHFHMPGDYDYESVTATIYKLAERERLAFEDAAVYLGYEVGFCVEYFNS